MGAPGWEQGRGLQRPPPARGGAVESGPGGGLPHGRPAGTPAAAPPARFTRRPPGPVARASLSLLAPAALTARDYSESSLRLAE